MRSRALTSTLALVALAGLAACAPPPDPAPPVEATPAVDLAAEEQTIRDYSMKWMAAENDRDLLAVMSFMAPDVTTILDGKIAIGRPAVEASTRARWEAFPDLRIEWATSSVHVAAAGDLAYERGSWTAGEDTGEFVCVWKKVDDEWKVVVDAGSTIQEAA